MFTHFTKWMAAVAVVAVAGVAGASTTFFEVETFDDGWSMGDYGWSADRRLPAGVDSVSFDDDFRLRLRIEGNDAQSSSWHNFQGIKRPTNLPSDLIQSISVDMYVGNWENEDHSVGLWSQMLQTDGDTSGWPMLVYRNSSFDYFDYVNNGWISGAAVTEFNRWYNLEIRMVQDDGLYYFVNGLQVGYYDDPFPWSYNLSAVILNAYNFGSDYDYYFDNLTTYAVVPVPPAAGLILLGMAGFGLRRKFMKK